MNIEGPLAADFERLLSGDALASQPVNLQRRSRREMHAAAEYAISVATNVANTLTHYGVQLANRSLLEIGPGIGFGSTLLLGEDCASIAVVDAYLAPWQRHFHPLLYREMRRLLGRPSRFLDRVVSAGKYLGIVDAVRQPAHSMRSIDDDSYDVIVSNAVLEHVDHLPDAIREMYRVTRPGGDGFHQVDFRCHRNFAWPLEHLLLTPAQFERIFEVTHGEIGCQRRVREVAELFESAGFEVRNVYVNMSAEPDYVAQFEVRLRRSDSTYRAWPTDELSPISASFCVRKCE